MNTSTALLILFLTALLEAAGDAIIRVGIHSAAIWQRVLLFAVGGTLLFLYGWTVNTAPWDFGRLIGIYVVFFFLVAQVISWLCFGNVPSARLLAGGALIVAGGLFLVLERG